MTFEPGSRRRARPKKAELSANRVDDDQQNTIRRMDTSYEMSFIVLQHNIDFGKTLPATDGLGGPLVVGSA
jgi:hypothetical protein